VELRDAKRVESVSYIILKDPNVKAILINILVELFVVTVGAVDATKNMGDAIKVPSLFVLKVLMQLIAKELIDNSGMPILSAVDFKKQLIKYKAALPFN
jgi:succinyl-CoA synthetase beta subunit